MDDLILKLKILSLYILEPSNTVAMSASTLYEFRRQQLDRRAFRIERLFRRPRTLSEIADAEETMRLHERLEDLLWERERGCRPPEDIKSDILQLMKEIDDKARVNTTPLDRVQQLKLVNGSWQVV